MSELAYKIGAVAERTGFSPALLRAWEQRYRLLEPQRSAGGQRLYTSKDMAVLARVRELLDGGSRIGEVAALGRERLAASGTPSAPPPRALGPGVAGGALLDALPCGVVLTDARGRTEWVNRAFSELCGYSLADLYQRTPGSVLQGPATDRETVAELRSALRERRPRDARILNYTKAGQLYWAELQVRPLGIGAEHRGFVATALGIGAEHRGFVATARVVEGASPGGSASEHAAHLHAATRSLAACASAPGDAARLHLALAQVVSALAAGPSPRPPGASLGGR